MVVRAPLYERLIAMANRDDCSFHVPGHKNGRAYSHMPNFAQLLHLDLTELPGLDDLHQPDGVIEESQRLAAKLFSAEETFFLVNGSTVGNLALILTACSPGDLILVQRNIHKSIIHGLMLAGARAVFLMPEQNLHSGTTLTVSTETIVRAMRDYPDARAVYLTNPTYYGASVDLTEVAHLVHEADMLLLVDEAHGAHFGFHPAWPRSAMQCGADGAVQSTHKMLAAMTMSGMLHVQGGRLDRGRLRRVLTMLQSSSPSYVLMASLDLARARLERKGSSAFGQLLCEIDWFRQQMQMSQEHVVLFSMEDPCKLLLQVPGLSGYLLQQQLSEQGCNVELADERQVLLVLSLETTRDDLERLLQALQIIGKTGFGEQSTTKMADNGIIYLAQSQPLSFSLDGPAATDSEEVLLCEATGKVSINTVTPYPPGIPFVLPGERYAPFHVDTLRAMFEAGARVHGMTVRDGQAFVRVSRLE